MDIATQKKEIEKELVEKIIAALEQKQITLVQMKEISNFILDSMDQIKDNPQLLIFFETLKNKWNIFEDTYAIYKNKLNQDKEKMVIDKLSHFISNFKN